MPTARKSAIRIELSGNLSVSEAAISTEAEQGRGGTINLLSDKLLLRQGQITTSVTDPLGLDAGDIAVTADTLVMVGGFIQANALAANTRGGDILIDNRQLLSGYGLLQLGGQERQVFSPQGRLNVIQAVSPDGIDGEIRVAEPDTDLTSVLSVLSKDYHQLRQLDADPCQVDDFRQVSSLILQGRGALPAGGLTP